MPHSLFFKGTRCTTRSKTVISGLKEKEHQKDKGPTNTSYLVSQDTTCSQERTSGKGAMVPRGAIVAIGMGAMVANSTCDKGRSDAKLCGEHGGAKKLM